jgi:hypothetical protein
MTRNLLLIVAALLATPGVTHAGWWHHHRHYQQPVYYYGYSAPAMYVMPVQGAPSGAESGVLQDLAIDVLRRVIDKNLRVGPADTGGGNQTVDSSLRADVTQLKADVAALSLRVENANSVLQTQGKKLIETEAQIRELRAAFQPDGEIGKILADIRSQTAKDNDAQNNDVNRGAGAPDNDSVPFGQAVPHAEELPQQQANEARKTKDKPAGKKGS